MSSQINDFLRELGLDCFFEFQKGRGVIKIPLKKIILDLSQKALSGDATNTLLIDMLEEISLAMKCRNASEQSINKIAWLFNGGGIFPRNVDTIYVIGHKLSFRTLCDIVSFIMPRFRVLEANKIFITVNGKMKVSKEDKEFFQSYFKGPNISGQVSMMEFVVKNFKDDFGLSQDCAEIYDVEFDEKNFHFPACRIEKCWKHFVIEEQNVFFPLKEIIQDSLKNKKLYEAQSVLLVGKQPSLTNDALELLEMGILQDFYPKSLQLYACNFSYENLLKEFQRMLSLFVHMDVKLNNLFNFLNFPF